MDPQRKNKTRGSLLRIYGICSVPRREAKSLMGYPLPSFGKVSIQTIQTNKTIVHLKRHSNLCFGWLHVVNKTSFYCPASHYNIKRLDCKYIYSTSTKHYVMILHCTYFIATGIMNINFTFAKRNPANMSKRILYICISLRTD